MLSDRSYMRAPTTERGTSALVWLISSVIAAFVLQLFFQSMQVRPGPDLAQRVALSSVGIRELHFWTLLSHAWVHDTQNILQIIGVVAGLVMLGGELLDPMGSRKFLLLYSASIVTGGLLWTLIHWNSGGVLIGATAGICGLLAYLAWLKPNFEVRFLLLFFIPVTVRPKKFVLLFGGVSIAACFFYEIYGAAAPFAYAPSSHVGGLIAGWTFYQMTRNGSARFSKYRDLDRSSDVVRRKGQISGDPQRMQPVPPSTQHERQRVEIDRILDKINSTGLNSLTSQEKRELNLAKNLGAEKRDAR